MPFRSALQSAPGRRAARTRPSGSVICRKKRGKRRFHRIRAHKAQNAGSGVHRGRNRKTGAGKRQTSLRGTWLSGTVPPGKNAPAGTEKRCGTALAGRNGACTGRTCAKRRPEKRRGKGPLRRKRDTEENTPEDKGCVFPRSPDAPSHLRPSGGNARPESLPADMACGAGGRDVP